MRLGRAAVVPERALQRRVGLFGATISGTGVIIGAGVYALIGAGADAAGNAVWVAFLVAAVVAGLSAASYARMALRVPKDSPEFQYAAHGLGFRAGFLAGWLMLWADIVAAGAVALAFGGYFEALIGAPLVVASLVLVVSLTVIALTGIRESVVIVGILTAAEVAGLVFVSVLGLPRVGDEALLETKDGFSGIWAASSLIFFAYIGFDELGNLAEEMRDPQRDLPRAIVLSLVLSTVLYVLVAVSAVSLIGSEALGQSSAPLADAVADAMGGPGRTILSLLALAATSNTVLLLLISGSRSLYGMSQAHALPPLFGWLGRRRTPFLSLLAVAAGVSGFVLLGDISLVARTATFSTLVAFAMVDISLVFVLRREAGGWPAALRKPAGLLQPVLGAAACIWVAADVGWTPVLTGTALCILGILVGSYAVRKRRLILGGGA